MPPPQTPFASRAWGSKQGLQPASVVSNPFPTRRRADDHGRDQEETAEDRFALVLTDVAGVVGAAPS